MADIKVRSRKDSKEVVVQYDIPETIQALTEKYGEENVVELAQSTIILKIQAAVRMRIHEDASVLQGIADAWEPGVRQAGVRKSPLERATASLSAMSAEDLAALLEKVKAARKHAGG